MTHFNKLVLLLLLLPFFTNAQSNYKPGYVVTSKGDTLHGLIDYRQWDNNPGTVAFKKEPGQGNPDIFTTKTANSFGVTGQEYFENHTVRVSQDPVDVANIESKLDTNYRIDRVFLQVINKGRFVILYRYKDNLKERFYLLETGQEQPYELAYHDFYNRDESGIVQYIKRFHIQLQNVAQKNDVSNDHLLREISQSNYSETDLTKIIQNINGNTSSQFTTQKLFGTRWFAGAGVNYSQSKFNGIIDFANAPASSSVFPKIDGGIDFLFNKDIQKFYFRVEVLFTVNGPYTFITYNVGGSGGIVTLKFKQYNTSVIPQFVYNLYNRDKLKVFIDAGIAYNFAAYNDYRTIIAYNSFSTATLDKYPELLKSYYSIPIKAGIVLNKKIEIYACYAPYSRITDYVQFDNSITSYQAGINYLFGGK